MANTVVVAGASGLVGTAVVDRFLDDGWNVVALSRRTPEVFSTRSFRQLSVDLRDATACRAAASDLEDTTHLVYTAVHELPGLIPGWREREQIDTNLVMLSNLLGVLTGSSLRHVTLLQGTKAYGVHLHPMRCPAREHQPRDDHENFYWLQEDHLIARAAEHGWDYTIMRPQLVVGPNYGVVMNLPPIIGAFAAICREEGLPFGFPGGAAAAWEAVDTRLVANAIRWAATTPEASGQHFNLTNGEVFSWRDLWPSMAVTLGVEPGPDLPVRIAQFLPDHAATWDTIVAKHDLRPIPMKDLVGESHHYADFCFAYGAEVAPPPAFVSTVKIKQAGFTEVCDTEQSFNHWLRVLIDRRILPPPG
jgi:nucleoside-diphosphate-sugar epimerase